MTSLHSRMDGKAIINGIAEQKIVGFHTFYDSSAIGNCKESSGIGRREMDTARLACFACRTDPKRYRLRRTGKGAHPERRQGKRALSRGEDPARRLLVRLFSSVPEGDE